MVIFILIFFAVILTVGAAAVLGFSFYLKRRTAKSLETKNQRQFADDAPPYRSLFEPDDEEIRALEREEKARVDGERIEKERKISFEKSERLREFENIWRAEPTKQNTIELLRLAAQSESAEIFSQTAENVIQVSKNEQAGALSKADLADLLDSHFRTLPQQERTSGAIFRLKKEIERLRRSS